jgi:hypothetical protein
MKRSLQSWLALCALLVSLFAVSTNAQLQTGNIYGKVQQKDGAILPGVTVTLTGVGAPQTFITDAQGSFRFINLSPGSYTLAAELEGFGKAVRSGIAVSVGRNADVVLPLNAKFEDTLIVVADANILDTRKAGTGINVTKVELERIPSSRDPWTVIGQTPGVQIDRINVGGSQSGQQSVYMGKGASATQNTFNVDGVNITDMGATGSSPLYYDFDSFEEMQITTGGADPRVQTPGVQLNMVTKRGTNDFRGSSRYFYTPGSYQADATVPGEASTYLDRTNRINFVRDLGAEFGGPVWKDHLWAWVAVSENKISNQASQAPGAVGAFDNIILRDKNAKLNAQLTGSNSAVGFYTFGDKVRNARNLSSTRPFDSAWRQTGPTKVYKLEDTQIFGSSFYLTGMASKVSGGFSLIPNGGTNITSGVWRDVSNVWHNSFLAFATDRPQKQYRLDGSKFVDIAGANHEFKFGFGYRSTPVSSHSSWPGANNGFVRHRASSYCAARGEANLSDCSQFALTRDRNAAYDEKYNDLYVGDTILLGNLTLQAGLRFDSQVSKNTASSSPANAVIGSPITVACTPQLAATGLCGAGNTITTSLPALSFAGDSRELRWRSVSPRIGLTYALGADKKSLLRAGYNRYVDQVGGTVAGSSPVGYVSYAYFIGDDRNHDGIAQRNEILRAQNFVYFDPQNPGAATSSVRTDYSMKHPSTDEFILGYEREVLTDLSVGLNYSYRKYGNLTFLRAEKTQGAGDWYTAADYVAAGQTRTTFYHCAPNVDPCNAGNALYTTNLPGTTYYDLKPGVAPPAFLVVTNRPDYTQKFQGLELTATKRLSNKWMLRGNVSYNDFTESCGAGSRPAGDPTPLLGNCPGGQVTLRSAGSGAFQNVFISSKWSYNVTGLYQLPWDLNLGASLTGRQGYPRPYRDVASVASGDKQVVIQPIGTTRFANVYELDLRAAKDFRIFDKVGVTLSADLFNAPNKRTVLQRETDLSLANGNYITELQSPRVWRFGAKVTF